MADRRKVVKAIEKCLYVGDACNECDYEGCVFKHGSCEKDLLADALDLLKEQEPVEPIKPIDVDDSFTYLCSNCKGQLFCGDRIRDKYCSTCGRLVKWDA